MSELEEAAGPLVDHRRPALAFDMDVVCSDTGGDRDKNDFPKPLTAELRRVAHTPYKLYIPL